VQTAGRIGKYELEQFLGGGMSHVYRATDTLIGRNVAVKILTAQGCADPETKARFLAEARMAGNIQHDNIIRIYDYGEDDGRPYMVMEFLVGQNLNEALQNGSAGDFEQKLRIAAQIARALEYVHSKGIIHRDIKPDNIHLDADGKAKLMDFGIAKTSGLSLTKAGFSLGTPYYMSPEQVLGQDVGVPADIYSFGILLFEMFTGVRPLTGDTVERLFYLILNEPLDLEPLHRAGSPEWLIDLITRCTAKKASDRPSNFTIIGEELERATEPRPKGAVKSEASDDNFPEAGNNSAGKYLAIGLLALILCAAGGLIWYKRPRPQPVYAPTLATETGLMVLVAGGPALTGMRNERVVVPPFYIDRTEVTNWAYSKFCAATGRALPSNFPQDRPDDPVVNVTFADASAFAKWAGKRLPDAIEWEKAARGSQGQQYPWGEADAKRANVSDNPAAMGRALPADSMAEGASPCNAIHMVGNVSEYVRNAVTPSAFAVEHYAKLLTPPPGGNEPWYSVKGGAFNRPLAEAVPWEFMPTPARYASADIGFRCAKDPPQH
jgi:serine/threonine-protein kinase